jgi:rhodanese-related sulfurtransferase
VVALPSFGSTGFILFFIESKIQIIDPSRRSLVYCHEGFRATTAASILLRASVGDIDILIDGVEGWSALGSASGNAGYHVI